MQNSTKIIVGVIVIILIIAGAWFYQKNTGPGSQTASSTDAIVLGAVMPLTGNRASLGNYMKDGLTMAKDDINAKGGVLGKKIRVDFEDGQGDAAMSVSAFEKQVAEGKKLVFDMISNVTLAIAPIAEKDKVINFNISSASPKISAAGDYTFRHNLLPQDEAKLMADLIYNKFGHKEIAFIYINAEAGIGYKDYFIPLYEKLGGKVKLIESYEDKSTDFRTQLLKIKSSGAKAVFAGAFGKDLGYMVKQAKELGLNVQWFGIYDTEAPDVLTNAGSAANGLIYSHFYKEDPNNTQQVEFKKSFEQKFGHLPGPYEALSYDALNLVAEALRQCNANMDTVCLKSKLYRIKDFPGVTGNISFDQNGDTIKTIFAKTIKNGQFVPLED